MTDQIRIKSALISVYTKEGISEIARTLEKLNVHIYSTGGTCDFLVNLGIPVTPVETVTSYPSILGGRVKTLHPRIFGGILWQRNQLADVRDVEKYDIPSFDLVVVDLYPFEKTLTITSDEKEIIEQIDIGGISLIRAAAKNFAHVLVIPSARFYLDLLRLLEKNNGTTNISERHLYATESFNVSSHYDTAIFSFFNRTENITVFKQSICESIPLRYGENPHQHGTFFGNLQQVFTQLHGKELSFNNLVDIDAGMNLIGEFSEPTVAIIKHTNPCGLASRPSLKTAYLKALECDPVSAFGGIIVLNGKVDRETAEELNKLFFEILLADDYENDARELLKSKKNRILLQKNSGIFPGWQFKSLFNGVLAQEKDLRTENERDLKTVTVKKPDPSEIENLVFANKIIKHIKSNAIALVKNFQLIGCGMGQTSRVDALKQAVSKAKSFGFETEGAVMVSDAFFPFPDCVQIAHEAGITSVLQPGGSIRDMESISYCNNNNMSMVFTGIRHFKH